VPARWVIAGFVLVLVGAAAGVAIHAYQYRIRGERGQRQRESLSLRTLDLLNTDKGGTVLGGPTTTFELSTVKFVGWRATLDSRLQGSQPTRYRLDSTYKFPAGQSYTVDDCQMISENQNQVTFTGRMAIPRAAHSCRVITRSTSCSTAAHSHRKPLESLSARSIRAGISSLPRLPRPRRRYPIGSSVAGHPYLSGYHGSAMNLGGTVRPLSEG
jgi:hypothetical protein